MLIFSEDWLVFIIIMTGSMAPAWQTWCWGSVSEPEKFYNFIHKYE